MEREWMMVRKLDDQSQKGKSLVDGSNGANNANEYSFMILFIILPAFFSDLENTYFLSSTTCLVKVMIISATKIMMLLILVVFVMVMIMLRLKVIQYRRW